MPDNYTVLRWHFCVHLMCNFRRICHKIDHCQKKISFFVRCLLYLTIEYSYLKFNNPLELFENPDEISSMYPRKEIIILSWKYQIAIKIIIFLQKFQLFLDFSYITIIYKMQEIAYKVSDVF